MARSSGGMSQAQRWVDPRMRQSGRKSSKRLRMGEGKAMQEKASDKLDPGTACA